MSKNPAARAEPAVEAAASDAALTPMMRQYLETKAQNPDAILFFRLGDFYEMFFDDAVRAAEILQITLTSRAKGSDRVPMCGVPYHSAKRYIAKLIECGLRVAICDQMEVPSGPGIVRREVTRVITPGMAVEDDLLAPGENNFLAAVVVAPRVGAALLDASTGEFLALAGETLDEVVEELARHAPRELLVPETEKDSGWVRELTRALGRPLAQATLPAAAFEAARGAALLKKHFQVASLAGFGLADGSASAGAAGAALRYLRETQRSEATHVDRLSVLTRGAALLVDEASLVNLEVLRTMKDGGRRGSLLAVLDRTSTSMGARRLARWLAAPLVDVAAINARLDAVDELAGQSALCNGLSTDLRRVADLERLVARLSIGTGTARDVRALGQSLGELPALAQGLGRCKSGLLRALKGPLAAKALEALSAEVLRALVDEPAAAAGEGSLFRAGFSAELDELVSASVDSREFLARLESRERERTGISSLKVRFNKVFGYFIEVTRSNLHLVPKDYTRKQTTVGAERFVTNELKEHEEKVLSAEEQRCAIEQRLLDELKALVLSRGSAIRTAADACASLDVLLSFARCAHEYGYVRPTVDDSEVIELVAGRHPVVERALQAEIFVPNDVILDASGTQILILTGPNMAGKSTVMRQVALAVLMAQTGSFVPAARARVGVCDRLFTRVGASDNLARGQSTFMVEMTETANILHHATRRSLVVLDEIGRGTSTFDGLSIAWAVAEHLHDRVGARTMFATHYHELCDLARERPRLRNSSIAVKEKDGRVVFLRKLVDGGASRSYGIEVARLAGLPPEVVARAKQVLGNLESGEFDDAGRPRASHGLERPALPEHQLGLFAGEATRGPVGLVEHQVLDEVRSVCVDATTPLEALKLLAGWKKALGPTSGG